LIWGALASWDGFTGWLPIGDEFTSCLPIGGGGGGYRGFECCLLGIPLVFFNSASLSLKNGSILLVHYSSILSNR